jgi:hypothetical protein
MTTAGDRPEIWLRDVAVDEGRVTERTAAFAAGFLRVGAKLSGGEALERFHAYVYVYSASDHQQAVTYFPAGETVLLSEGKYDLRIQLFRSHDQPEIWKYGVAVRSGGSASHEVAFDSGRLIVRCMRGGQEQTGDNAFISVYEAGERRTPVAKARAGEKLVLRSGKYDVRVRHTVTQRELWATGITVRSGSLMDHAVRMD